MYCFCEVAKDEQLLEAAELVGEFGLPVGSAALLPRLLGDLVEHERS